MTRPIPGVAWCACVVLAATAIAAAPLPAARGARASDEVRGVWVLRTSLSSRSSIDAMVRTARAGGFNTLLVQVRGRGEAYYKSSIDPRASDLDGQPLDFDPLATTVELGHRAGLRVHAWINIDLVSSAATLPRSREHVVFRHPDWLMVPKPLANELRDIDVRSPAYVGRLARWTRSSSSQVEGLYISPVSADAQQYSASVITEIVSRYPIDGVHFDYLRYPNETFDYSTKALEEYRATRAPLVSPAERQRLDRQAVAEPAAWANMFPEGWSAFRRDRLTTLAQRLRGAAKAVRPDIMVSAAVGPSADDATDHRFQDWGAWASGGLLDVVCPMTYTMDLAEFTELVTRARAAAGSAAVWAGIGAWQLPVARTADHVRAARKAGAAGVLLFSYDRLTAADARPANYFDELRQVFLGLPPSR